MSSTDQILKNFSLTILVPMWKLIKVVEFQSWANIYQRFEIYKNFFKLKLDKIKKLYERLV